MRTPRKKFVAEIELRPTGNWLGQPVADLQAKIRELITLDMWTLADPESKPNVNVKEVMDDRDLKQKRE